MINPFGIVTKLSDLTPGDAVLQYGHRAIFVCMHIPHPVYPGLALVVWYMDQLMEPRHGNWSHDALSPYMELTDAIVDTSDRDGNLRKALFNT